MKQTIIALIRPELNLAKPFNQAAHLIEHLLITPERRKRLKLDDAFYANNIISDVFWTSELFVIEGYVVRSETAKIVVNTLIKHAQNVYLNRKIFKAAQNALIQELAERKANSANNLIEQLERTIFTSDSPAVMERWHNPSKLNDLDAEKVEKIFRTYGRKKSLAILEFEQYKINPPICVRKNTLRHRGVVINLTHPKQTDGSASVNILIPYNPKIIDPLLLRLYCRSLGLFPFGMLHDELRHKSGLVYDVFARLYQSADAINIGFSCSEDRAKEALAVIRKVFINYDKFIDQKFPLFVNSLIKEYELDWGNLEQYGLFYLEEAILSNFILPPSERIKLLPKIKPISLFALHAQLKEALKKESIITILKHGDKGSIKVLK